jgi:hypothetical protein
LALEAVLHQDSRPLIDAAEVIKERIEYSIRNLLVNLGELLARQALGQSMN